MKVTPFSPFLKVTPFLTPFSAITRTQTDVDLWCEKTAFKAAVAKPTLRHMGLKHKLDS